MEAIVELGLRHSVIEAPVRTSSSTRSAFRGEDVLHRIKEAVSSAAGAGVQVAFFGVDGSRADLDFAADAYRAAVDAGAEEAVVVDTLGIAAPEAVSYFVDRVRRAVGPQVPLHYHGHDDFGLATAGAVAAVKAGATWIHGTVNGMGERAGNASLCEIALALEALYGYETSLRLEHCGSVSRRVAAICGYPIEPWKPLVGENLFRRETGAVAAQFHDPPAVEPYASELVGARRAIVLGKKSGADSIRIKLDELGLDVPEEGRPDLLAAVKQRATAKRGLVSDDEFRELVELAAKP